MKSTHSGITISKQRRPSAALCALAATAVSLSSHPLAARDAQNALVEKVRSATAQFTDINVPLSNGEGWVVGTPCVSGPDFGAMGVHLVNPGRLDGVVNVNAPESLIYEPLPSGAMRLVGVEYIVIASEWAKLHPNGPTPEVEGHLMNYVGEPNRFGLHAFYELHVWAWQDNPKGTVADWNPKVTCDHQPAT